MFIEKYRKCKKKEMCLTLANTTLLFYSNELETLKDKVYDVSMATIVNHYKQKTLYKVCTNRIDCYIECVTLTVDFREFCS